MTERLYLNDSYLYDFEASVVKINRSDRGFEVVLDKTAFYPETGGQLYDQGILDGQKVIAAFETEQDEILHLVENWTASIGASVRGSIDPVRRADNRRKHTGQHILSRAFIEVAGADTVSSRLGEVESTIELSVGVLDEAAIARAETLANDIILENLSVSIRYFNREELNSLPIRKIPEREGKFRIVQVGEFDYTACGGTHCHYTGEVGLVRIIAQEKLRGHLRVTFLSGRQAIEDYGEKHTVVTRLSGKLTCHFRDLPAAVDKLADQNQSLRREVNQYAQQVLLESMEKFLETAPVNAGVKIYSALYDNYDVKVIKEISMRLCERIKAVLIIGSGDKVLISSSGDSGVKASKMAQLFMASYGGKGGGSDSFAQVGGLKMEKRDENIAQFVNILRNEIVY